jgi:hypothetical protein
MSIQSKKCGKRLPLVLLEVFDFCRLKLHWLFLQFQSKIIDKCCHVNFGGTGGQHQGYNNWTADR